MRGPLDFRIVQEKIALSQKIFLAEVGAREGDVSSPFGGRRMTKTIFQHVYLERDEDNIYVSHSLSRRVTLLLDGSIFL